MEETEFSEGKKGKEGSETLEVAARVAFELTMEEGRSSRREPRMKLLKATALEGTISGGGVEAAMD